MQFQRGPKLIDPPLQFRYIFGSSNLVECAIASKVLDAAQRANVPVAAWLWSRRGDPPNVPKGVSASLLLSGGGENHPRLLRWYVRWMCLVFVRVLLEPSEVVFFCDRFESAFPVAVASILRPKRFIFANTDNVCTSYRWPRVVRFILAAAERLTVRRAILHLVPGVTRWPRPDGNLRVIPNTPSQSTIEAAQKIAQQRTYEPGPLLTLYVNGLLTETRGIRTLLNAIERCRAGLLRVLVAGMPACVEAEKLVTLPCVEYLGQLSVEESLATYYRAHLAFTFYDPKIAINRVAEPNKWGDCVATGTPFITNAEVQTARPFLLEKQCVAVPYADDKGLCELLTDLSRDSRKLSALRRAMGHASVQPSDRAWDSVMTTVLAYIKPGARKVHAMGQSSE